MVDVKEIIASLPRLSPEERSQVAAAAKALASNAPLKAGKGEFVLQCIVATAEMQGLELRPPESLRRSTSYVGFTDKAVKLETWLANAVDDRTAQRALLMLGLRLLVENIRDMNLNVGSSMLMRHIHRLPAVMDRHFPGYYEAGVLGMIVKRGMS